MNDTGAKQQIVEKIKSGSNILVTVSTNPSVDELSAALGLTVLLNKMKKHATAVFSGAIPPAITFLDPQKTFENTVDSLRDFIIALDKEKADHLRYKVDGDVVKIFITPYRTTITGDDLDFSQGDYNVDVILALGVKNQDHLDQALAAHGRILHDATVATISAGSEKSNLGSIDWREENASSLSEMIVTLSDALKTDKTLLDEQIATAFLTGIVAATDRFSNNRTSSRVMTMAAQLMGAGANQQLIASKLEEGQAIGPDASASTSDNSEQNADGTTDLSEGESTKLDKKPKAPKPTEPPKKKEDDGSLTISHEKEGDLDEVAQKTEAENQAEAAKRAEEELAKQTEQVPQQNQDEAAKLAEQNLAKQLSGVAPAAAANTPSVADLQKDLAEAQDEVEEASEQAPTTVTPPTPAPSPAPLSGAVSAEAWKNSEGPSMGGTLNATTEQAAEDARREEEADRNHTILSHGGAYVGNSEPMYQSPLNAASIPPSDPPMIDPLQPPAQKEPEPAYTTPFVPPSPTLADLDEQNRAPQHDEARAAIDAAFNNAPAPAPSGAVANPFGPAPQSNLPPLPPLPDFSTLPPLPQDPGFNNTPVQPGPLPPENLGEILPQAPAPAPTNTTPADPGQFRIPGQP